MKERNDEMRDLSKEPENPNSKEEEYKPNDPMYRHYSKKRMLVGAIIGVVVMGFILWEIGQVLQSYDSSLKTLITIIRCLT